MIFGQKRIDSFPNDTESLVASYLLEQLVLFIVIVLQAEKSSLYY